MLTLRVRNTLLRISYAFALILLASLMHRLVAGWYDITDTYSVIYNFASDFNPIENWWSDHRGALKNGVVIDLWFAFLAALVLSPLRKRSATLLILLLLLFYAGNIDHIRYNHAHLNFLMADRASDTTFLRGSVFNSGIMRNTAVLFATALFIILLFRRWFIRPLFPLFLVVALVFGLLLDYKYEPLRPDWMQSHPLVPAFSRIEAQAAADAPVLGPRSEIDLANEPGAPSFNLLIVFLEGLSQASIDRGDMRFLESLQERSLRFSSYVSQQLQTDNGLYTVFTGDLPYFIRARSKWAELDETSNILQESLPLRLREAGFQTAFLQSAHLHYMAKDEKLNLLGFETILGGESWEKSYSRNGWGIDDLSLFEYSIAHIDQFDHDRPWFLALLTTGTHSPYNVPADFLPEHPARYRALKYADQATEVLFKAIEERGLLDNTVVVITSDESRETGPTGSLQRELMLNWLPLIILHPEDFHHDHEEPFSMTQLRALLEKLLHPATGFDELKPFLQTSDDLLFGNIIARRIFWYHPNMQRLYACYTDTFICAHFEGHALFSLGEENFKEMIRLPKFEAVIRQAEGLH